MGLKFCFAIRKMGFALSGIGGFKDGGLVAHSDMPPIEKKSAIQFLLTLNQHTGCTFPCHQWSRPMLTDDEIKDLRDNPVIKEGWGRHLTELCTRLLSAEADQRRTSEMNVMLITECDEARAERDAMEAVLPVYEARGFERGVREAAAKLRASVSKGNYSIEKHRIMYDEADAILALLEPVTLQKPEA
jgi:hypothetical protein